MCSGMDAQYLIFAGSQSLHTFDYRVEDPGSIHISGSVQRTPTPALKERAMTPAELVKRLHLHLDTLTISPSTTVILRNQPTRSRRRRSSAQALNNIYCQAAADDKAGPSPNKEPPKDPAERSSTQKESTESLKSDASGKESMKRRNSHRFLRAKSNPETLSTIEESSQDTFAPTVLTTEKAAAVKISMETYYNDLLQTPESRLARLRFLETGLYFQPHFSPEEKNIFRHQFYNTESCHLRQCRVLRSQSLNRRQNKISGSSWQHFEPLRVLGRGSFGVVRLVREKRAVESPFPKQVFAMKIIRKSEMLSSSQEGHLRAERDFLVAAEGSNWYI